LHGNKKAEKDLNYKNSFITKNLLVLIFNIYKHMSVLGNNYCMAAEKVEKDGNWKEWFYYLELTCANFQYILAHVCAGK
jgi:hypothetical protein